MLGTQIMVETPYRARESRSLPVGLAVSSLNPEHRSYRYSDPFDNAVVHKSSEQHPLQMQLVFPTPDEACRIQFRRPSPLALNRLLWLNAGQRRSAPAPGSH